MKRKYAIILILEIVCLGLAGCTTYNAATGRHEFIAISTTEEISLGQAIHEEILKENTLSEDAARLEKVKTIGSKLAQVSDRQDYVLTFHVIEKDELNAFTTPGGNVYFYAGLMDKLKTDDQIAFVLAHEIGHGAARHTIKKFQAALGYNLIGSLILSQLNLEDQSKELAVLGSGALMSVVFSAYGRQDEYEADRLGVKYMYLAGYDPQAAIESLEVLKSESHGSYVPLILRSHPYIDDRIEAVKKEMSTVKYQYGE